MDYNFSVSFWRKRAVKAALDRRDDNRTWCGYRFRKFPGDGIAMQELLCRVRPQVLVELGTQYGGSTLFFSSFAAQAGIEAIVTADIVELERPNIPIATFLTGDDTSEEVFSRVKELVGDRTCSVVIDSDHRAEHVDKELELYGPLVTPGQALIMEDTHVDVLDFKKFREHGGPLRSIQKYMPKHPEFELTTDIEPYITSNFFGYWVKKAS